MRPAVATPHHLATDAGLRAMAGGGSAVDGALAAAAVLAVVYPHNCALGGDLIALVRRPGGEATVVNASGPAPLAVDVGRLRAAGAAMPVAGADTVTVPGLVAGWGALHGLAGRRPFAAALADAVRLAREGVPVTPRLAEAIGESPGVAADAGMREVFAPGGRPLAAGERLRQPALARTLEALAAGGPRAFYAGPLAAGLADLGSAVTARDLAAFEPAVEAPLRADLGDCTLLTARPNSAGVLLAQALLAVRATGVRDPLGRDAGVLAAVFAAGAAQRDRDLADPRWFPTADQAWLGAGRLAEIARQATRHRPPPRAAPGRRADGDTVAVVATDADGCAVSLIQSLYHAFGAQVLEPRTGVLLHNRGSSFSLDPAHPNVIAPGKRPAHTLIPVVVERDGALLGVLGAMGGKVQAQVHAQVLLRLLAGTTAAEAVAAPRFAVGAMEEGDPPGVVRVEEDAYAAVGAALRAAGLAPVEVPGRSEELGHAQAVWCDPADAPQAGTDPRADGSP